MLRRMIMHLHFGKRKQRSLGKGSTAWTFADRVFLSNNFLVVLEELGLPWVFFFCVALAASGTLVKGAVGLHCQVYSDVKTEFCFANGIGGRAAAEFIQMGEFKRTTKGNRKHRGPERKGREVNDCLLIGSAHLSATYSESLKHTHTCIFACVCFNYSDSGPKSETLLVSPRTAKQTSAGTFWV